MVGPTYCLVVVVIGFIGFLFARGDRFEEAPYEAPTSDEWPKQ